MIGSKYGKVIIIALINVCGVCIVYNNVATNDTGVLHENVVVERQVVNEAFKHADRTTKSHVYDIMKYKTVSNSLSTPNIKLNTYPNSDSQQVQSMKNLLSSKTKLSIKDQTLPITSATIEDEELKRKLLDSSEIDLYPPNPIIISSSKKVKDKENYNNLMTERSEMLKQQCSDNNRNRGVQSSVMYVLESFSLVWCPVYKAASTNWMHNLLHLAGKKEDEINKIIKDHPNQPNDQARIVAPVSSLSNIERISRKEDARLLLIVRHPFDRLVSAFRDKLEQCHGPENCTLENNWYYKKYGKSIVSQYRAKAIEKFGDSFFNEKNNFGAPLPVMRTWRSSAYPSWWEFVQYIIHTSPSTYDEHWKPSSLYCSVCSFPYNHILHLETIVTEEKFFAEEMGAENLIHPRWENRNDEGLAKEEILGKYFSLLDDRDINALYKIYEDDFKMFGYQFIYKDFKFNVNV